MARVPIVDALIRSRGMASDREQKVSPEALGAAATFRDAREALGDRLAACVGGRELSAMGYAHDIAWIADLDATECVAVLREGKYVSYGGEY